MLGDRDRGHRRAPARARRLVHLAVDQHGPPDDARIRHVEQHLVPFARALPHAREDRKPIVALHHGVDELHDKHGLAHPGAAEHGGLAALGDRRHQVDRLDAGGEQFRRPAAHRKPRRRAVDRAAGNVCGKRCAAVADLAQHVDQPTQHRLADRRRHRAARCAHSVPAAQAICRTQCDRAYGGLVEMSLSLRRDRASVFAQDFQRIVERRQGLIRKTHVDHGAAHRYDASVRLARLVSRLRVGHRYMPRQQGCGGNDLRQ